MKADGERTLVVVGAGIAGLAAARAAREAARSRGVRLGIRVLEKAREVGGRAVTVREGGWLLEGGPTGYLDNEPAMDPLVAAAGLAKLPANDAAARRFLVRGTRMREIRPHPLKFAASGILSPGGLLRLAMEPWRGRGAVATAMQAAGLATEGGSDSAARGAAVPVDLDESVWDFAARRLGPEAADRLIAPMVLGVFAGDAKRLSLRAAFPRMAELEAEHGSLIRAMIALQKARRGQGERPRGGPAGPGGALISFTEGVQALPRALAERGAANGDFTIHCGVAVAGLERTGERWRLRLDRAPSTGGIPLTREADATQPSLGSEPLEADAVVLAGECYSTAELLASLVPTAAAELRAIPTPPVTVVGLGLGPEALAAAPRGFGALIQRGGPLRILGMLWDTHLFPGRSPDGTLLVRCLLGGAVDPEVCALDDEALVELVRTDLARVLGPPVTAAPPRFTRIVRWPRAIPQYELGHVARVKRIEAAIAEHPGLQLAGNYLSGVAFTKAAKSGSEAGRAAWEALSSQE